MWTVLAKLPRLLGSPISAPPAPATTMIGPAGTGAAEAPNMSETPTRKPSAGFAGKSTTTAPVRQSIGINCPVKPTVTGLWAKAGIVVIPPPDNVGPGNPWTPATKSAIGMLDWLMGGSPRRARRPARARRERSDRQGRAWWRAP